MHRPGCSCAATSRRCCGWGRSHGSADAWARRTSPSTTTRTASAMPTASRRSRSIPSSAGCNVRGWLGPRFACNDRERGENVMSKALRLSEKWFRRGLWLVAVVFAGFLIGLGGTVVNDLPKVEKPLVIDDFLDRPAADRLRATSLQSTRAARDAQAALEQARLKQ